MVHTMLDIFASSETEELLSFRSRGLLGLEMSKNGPRLVQEKLSRRGAFQQKRIKAPRQTE